MCGDATNWDEEAYKESILREREIQTRTVFRTVWAPSLNPNPECVVVASSDGSIASYSVSSCVSKLVSETKICKWLWIYLFFWINCKFYLCRSKHKCLLPPLQINQTKQLYNFTSICNAIVLYTRLRQRPYRCKPISEKIKMILNFAFACCSRLVIAVLGLNGKRTFYQCIVKLITIFGLSESKRLCFGLWWNSIGCYRLNRRDSLKGMMDLPMMWNSTAIVKILCY